MSTRLSLLIVPVLLPLLTTGCCLPGGHSVDHLAASQLRSQELYAENEQLRASLEGQMGAVAGLEAERQMLSRQVNELGTQLATANGRVDNLLAERNELKQRYSDALLGTGDDPLMTGGPGVNVPGFEHDSLTGLNKFPEDVLFDLGSAEIRPEALPVLKEFANQVNSPGTAGLRVLIVGHTDDQRIARGSTARKHPTNWHLSTNRADEVILKLKELGIAPERMAAMGYSRFQPLEASTDETARQRNRRVELYVVPESLNLAMWDPVRALQ